MKHIKNHLKRNQITNSYKVLIDLKEYIKKKEESLDFHFYNEFRDKVISKLLKKKKYNTETKEFLSLPHNFEIQITDKVFVLEDWFEKNKKEIIGFDTESDFNKRGIALYQFSTSKSCILYQGKNEMEPIIPKIFLDEKITKVIFGTTDLDLMNRINPSFDLSHLERNNILDVQSTVKKYNIIGNNFKNSHNASEVCEFLIGKGLKKDLNIIFSRWSSKILSVDQIEYSSLDSYFLVLCYPEIIKKVSLAKKIKLINKNLLI
jgi:ribonuclease D